MAVPDAADVLRTRLQLRRPWADETKHLRFEPTALLERLAVLVPRPRVNPLLYYGVLAPRVAWRAEVVPRVAARPAGRRWADLMRRAFSTVAKALVDPPEPRRRLGTWTSWRVRAAAGADGSSP